MDARSSRSFRRALSKGNLRYRWSLLGIPKKNGKSTIPAVIESCSGCWERPPSRKQQWAAWQDDQLGELLFGFRSGGRALVGLQGMTS